MDVSQVAAVFEASPGLALGLCVFFMILGIILIKLDLLFISGGFLSAAALVCAAVSVWCAFQVNTTLGWGTLVSMPIVCLIAFQWAVRRIADSSLVAHSVVEENAGYGHHLSAMNITVGSEGVLKTPALPTGRARFDDGEADVQIIDGTAGVGSKVAVASIDGPVVFVRTLT